MYILLHVYMKGLGQRTQEILSIVLKLLFFSAGNSRIKDAAESKC